jgi:hypothetical protein
MDEHAAHPACCGSGLACVFAQALLARAAACPLAVRSAQAERTLVECSAPVSHVNCQTLLALLFERSRFALRLPPVGRPLMHQQALRLQCGGVAALAQCLGSDSSDVHGLVGLAQARHGSLTELPWAGLVQALATWQPPRRRPSRP